MTGDADPCLFCSCTGTGAHEALESTSLVQSTSQVIASEKLALNLEIEFLKKLNSTEIERRTRMQKLFDASGSDAAMKLAAELDEKARLHAKCTELQGALDALRRVAQDFAAQTVKVKSQAEQIALFTLQLTTSKVELTTQTAALANSNAELRSRIAELMLSEAKAVTRLEAEQRALTKAEATHTAIIRNREQVDKDFVGREERAAARGDKVIDHLHSKDANNANESIQMTRTLVTGMLSMLAGGMGTRYHTPPACSVVQPANNGLAQALTNHGSGSGQLTLNNQGTPNPTGNS
jgi:hypothetical protein